MEIGQAVKRGREIGGDWARGVWLMLLYLLSVVVVVTAFSAYQLQHNIRSFDAGGETLGVWRVYQYLEQWNELQQQKVAAADRLRAARTAFDQKTTADDEKNLALDLAVAKFRITAEGFLRLIEGEVPERANDIADIRLNCCDHGTTSAINGLLPMLPLPFREGDAFKQAKTELNQATDAMTLASEEQTSAAVAVHSAQERVNLLADALQEASDKIVDLSKSFGNSSATRDAVGDFMNQINYTATSYFGRIISFETMPTDTLTLILVLAMGTLGGTIHLTRVYLQGEARGIGYFLYRPLLGAITALAVYIIARAGVFVLSDPAGGDGRSPLSPFFISFLAIISGLLAESALDAIEAVGSKWFSGAQQRQRWAHRVQAEMAAQAKNISEIEPLLGIDSARSAAWLEEREPVPPEAQTAIAVWLQKPARELFSDLPPPKPATS